MATRLAQAFNAKVLQSIGHTLISRFQCFINISAEGLMAVFNFNSFFNVCLFQLSNFANNNNIWAIIHQTLNIKARQQQIFAIKSLSILQHKFNA